MSKKESPSVCFIVTSLESGGIENYLLRFLSFTLGKIKPIVVCKSGKLGALHHKYENVPNIEILPLEIGYFDPVGLTRLYRVYRRYNCSAICDFTGNFAGLPMLIGKLSNVERRIAFYRGATNHFKETKMRLLYNSFVRYLTGKYSTKILSNSYAALDFFFPNRKPDNGKFEVIYNGIDSNSILNFESHPIPELSKLNTFPNKYIIGHIGRYSPAKNHRAIIEVAKILFSKNDDIYIVVCGKNTENIFEDYPDLPEYIRERFVILGYRSDIPNVLDKFDLFFFPSLTEGQPNALIEAMIAGLPIVASNIKPIVETTPEICHSTLVDPNNYSQFANVIEKCVLQKGEDFDIEGLKRWAIDNFDPNKNFSKFLIELI